MVRRSHDTPANQQDDEGTAPADLLQMWISGRDAAAARVARTSTADESAAPEPAVPAAASDLPETPDATVETEAPEAPAAPESVEAYAEPPTVTDESSESSGPALVDEVPADEPPADEVQVEEPPVGAIDELNDSDALAPVTQPPLAEPPVDEPPVEAPADETEEPAGVDPADPAGEPVAAPTDESPADEAPRAGSTTSGISDVAPTEPTSSSTTAADPSPGASSQRPGLGGRGRTTPAPWASAPPSTPVGYGRMPAETTSSQAGPVGRTPGGSWWPYSEPASTDETPTDETATGAAPEVDGADTPAGAPTPTATGNTPVDLHDEVETEWSPADAADAPVGAVDQPTVTDTDTDTATDTAESAQVDESEDPAPAPVTAASETTPEPPAGSAAAPTSGAVRPGGWAAFGGAQTAEEVLDRLGPRPSFSGTGFPRSPGAEAPATTAVSPVQPTASETSTPEPPTGTAVAETPDAASAVEPEAADRAEPEPGSAAEPETTDLSATTHWSLDDFEAYIRAQSSNELESWMGPKSRATTPVEEPPASAPATESAPDLAAAPDEPVAPDEAAEPALFEPPAEQPAEALAAQEPVEQPAAVEPTPDRAGSTAMTPGLASDAAVAEEPDATSPPEEKSGGMFSRLRAAVDPRPATPAEPTTSSVTSPTAPAVEPADDDLADDDLADDDLADDSDHAWAQADVEWDQHDDPADPGVSVDTAPDPETPEVTAEPEAVDPDATQYVDTLPALDETDPGSDVVDVPDTDATPQPTPEPTPEPAQDPPASYAPSEPTPAARPETQPTAQPATQPDLEPELEPLLEADEVPQAGHQADPEAEDFQEWHDDHGLRWVSNDGGYTWYSDDGQGWNAEIGEPIEVPAGHRPAATVAAPSDPEIADDASNAPASGAPAQVATEVAPPAEPPVEPVDQQVEQPVDLTKTAESTEPAEPVAEVTQEPPAAAVEPWPEEPQGISDAAHEAFADEVWPSTSSGTIPAVRDDAPATQSMWPGEAPQALPPSEPAAVAAESAPTGPPAPASPFVEAPATVAAEPAAEVGLAPIAGTQPATGEEQIPPFVEYKPRGAFRPLLGFLFVAAAVLAVVAIFWAVSQGSQAATGIAAGVTGFALAFWWGLLSWTPTIVSLSGSVLEVARGSDGERFDLRSPKLMIDVDDDTGSRNWRTTITRPNGTELVIPASAVDPDEFAMIVRHYRAEAEAGQASQVRGR